MGLSKGRLFVISASSGTGKTTLARELLKDDKNLVPSISYTTRPPRASEQNGADYYFVTKQEFSAIRRRNGFLEWANVFGHSYGTPRKEVEEHLKRRRNVLLLIDVQGAKTVKRVRPNAVFVFLSPPSKTELKKRLEKRGTESKKEIQKRLRVATRELRELNAMTNGRYLCDYRIVNRDIHKAREILRAIIRAESSG
ncbi:MAG: guanylate kinase [Candidatus Omnitrophica bacterium]|nr:guanylate kinase [Candidatus Omnitrophota bacterium]